MNARKVNTSPDICSPFWCSKGSKPRLQEPEIGQNRDHFTMESVHSCWFFAFICSWIRLIVTALSLPTSSFAKLMESMKA